MKPIWSTSVLALALGSCLNAAVVRYRVSVAVRTPDGYAPGRACGNGGCRDQRRRWRRRKGGRFLRDCHDVWQANIAELSGSVIAYRGTNFNRDGGFFDSALWSDTQHGWSAGAGVKAEQAKLAHSLCDAVAHEIQ